MSRQIDSFEALLAPMSVAEFMAEYRGRKPLHIQGGGDKFAGVMGWDLLTRLINQSSIWSAASMQLVLDGKRVDPKDFCTPAIGRDKATLPIPDLDRVRGWLQRGASLLLNDIDQLSPGLKAAAAALEAGLGGKVQGNLYCSWQAHQGFGSHYDTHEVFAVHVAGEKTWRLYERHFQDPIAHAAFQIKDDAFHARHKGRLTAEVTLKPGDLLYIPRGWYHDALATSEATIHVAYGVTCPIGVDLFSRLFERAVQEPRFRAAVPDPDADGGTATAEHLATLGDTLATLVREPAVVEKFAAFMRGYRYPRADLRLPDDAVERRWRRATAGLRLAQQNGAWVLTDGRQRAPIPPGTDKPIGWILEHESFAERDFAAAFPALAENDRRGLLASLEKMAVIALG